jgi:hypothetical protein
VEALDLKLRHCKQCLVPLSSRNKVGYCKQCFNFHHTKTYNKPKGRERTHTFKTNDTYGCWKLLEDRTAGLDLVRAICIVCNKTIKGVEYSVLRRGTSKHCGCQAKSFEVGSRVRNFEVVQILAHPKISIKCLECNNIKNIDRYRFLSRKTKCSSCNVSKRSQIQPNMRFGDLTTIEFTNLRGIRCKCSCEKETVVDYVALLNGSVRSCGCKTLELRKNTNLELLGVEYYSQSEAFSLRKKELAKKHRQTKIENGNMVVLSDGRLLWDVCNENQVPFPFVFRLYQAHGEQAALDYCTNYKGRKIFWTTEQALIDLLSEEFVDLKKYDKNPIEFKLKRKPDFRLEKDNKVLYINTDGLYYHCEQQKDPKYHSELQQSFSNNGQVIFQIREDELRDKPEVVKSIILNHFGVHCDKYNARSCEVRQVLSKEADLFFSINHLMGRYSSARAFGLYYKEKLVCCISIRCNKKDNSIEIARFGSLINTSVRGGFSKLLNYVENIYKPSKVISFCDLRYSTGKSYEKLGFKLEKTTLGWRWTDFNNTFNRLQCRTNMDERVLTQAEYAKELGWYKIYDAGQAKYVKELG